MEGWRPDKREWIRQRNWFFGSHQAKFMGDYPKTRQLDYEAGADAMLEAVVQFIGGVFSEKKWQALKGSGLDET